MEGDVFGDAGFFEPLLELISGHLAGESFEDRAFGAAAAEFKGFGGDGEGGLGVGLFGLETEAGSAVGILFDILPFKGEYIADSKACETAEQRRGFKYGNLAGSVGELLEFFKGEIFAAGFDVGDGFLVFVDVFLDEMVPVSDGEEGSESGVITGGGVLGEFTAFVGDLRCVQQIPPEALAELDGDVGHGAAAVDVLVEVVVGERPVFIVFLHLGAVSGEEVHLGSGAVYKAVLLVEDGEFALGADAFGDAQFLGVFFAVLKGLGVLFDVYAEVFAAGKFEGLWVAYRRPEVQIEGDLAAWKQSLSECYFCG